MIRNYKMTLLLFCFALFLVIAFPLYMLSKVDDTVYQNTYGRYIDEIQDVVAIIGGIAAAAGFIFIAYQFKREKDLHEAEYITRLNQDFLMNQSINEVYNTLEKSMADNQQSNPFTDEDIINLANYLSYFEIFYPLISKNIIKINTIDPILAYRFFLATNNRFVQEMLLCRNGKELAWKNIYLLHYVWREYRKGDIIQSNYELAHTKQYKKIVF